ncbi:MAG: cupredoxin domain-containing protein [Methanolinea sp.]|nr:cupredoxin domain-containing protein [Methanolinea sp.]
MIVKLELSLLLLIAMILAFTSGCTGTPGPGPAVTPTPVPATATATPLSTTSPASSPSATPAGTASPAATTVSPTPPPEVSLTVTARGFAFDKSTITVPAGSRVTITFENKDQGASHNIAFYTSNTLQNIIYIGKIINGPATTTYTFTAPATSGTYYFRCDLHPVMNGQFIVV